MSSVVYAEARRTGTSGSTRQLLYVHVAEKHGRDVPAAVIEAGQGEMAPDLRILKVFAARAPILAAGYAGHTITVPRRSVGAPHGHGSGSSPTLFDNSNLQWPGERGDPPDLPPGRATGEAVAYRTPAALFGGNPWRLQAWMGHKRIDETMLYVHVAENHRRDLPAAVIEAGQGETDPDRRILRMLGARGKNLAKEAGAGIESRDVLVS